MDIKRVDRSSGAKGVGAAKAKGSAPKGMFASLLDEVTGAPAGAVGAISAMNAIEALLAVQESGDALESEGKARQRAEKLLDQMDELRLSLLGGAIPRKQLESLAHMAQSQREMVQNPQLKSVLDEIDLRAQVELAKYTPQNFIV